MFDYFNLLAFDNEPEPDPDPTPEPGDDEKKFSQSELNSLMAKQKRELKVVQEKLMVQLEEAKKASKIGSEERTSLETQIEDLRKQTMSAEERAKQKEGKLQKQHQEELEQAKTEIGRWQGLYTNSTISNSLLKAASANKARSPEQILMMFKHDVKLAPKLDENGKPTDNFEARLDFVDINDDGKEVQLNLTVEEAVKRMSELPRYGNLFEGSKVGGLDGNNVRDKQGKLDLAKLAKTDPARFRKLRKENPNLYQ